MSGTNQPSRVLLVDDHPSVMMGLTILINAEKDLRVCGTARTPEQARQQLRAACPNVIVLDLSLGSFCGVEFLRELRAQRPAVPVLVYSCHQNADHVCDALRAGANGYVTKDDIEHVVPALRSVLAGGRYLTSAVVGLAAQAAWRPESPPSRSPLSERERQVYEMLGRGNSVAQIANTLCLSVKTVHTHCARMKQKLGLDSERELLIHAVRTREQRPLRVGD